MDDLIATLRRKGFVEVEQHLIEYAGEWHRLKPGDRYLGQHKDAKPELLTCRRLEVQRRASQRVLGKIFPKERKDSRGKTPRLFGLEEVIKVTIRDNPNYVPDKKEPVDERPDTTPVPIEADLGPVHADGGDNGNTGAVPEHDGVAAAADDRSGQREDSPRPRATPRPPVVPGDPRTRAGRTDYTSAARAGADA